MLGVNQVIYRHMCSMIAAPAPSTVTAIVVGLPKYKNQLDIPTLRRVGILSAGRNRHPRVLYLGIMRQHHLVSLVVMGSLTVNLKSNQLALYHS